MGFSVQWNLADLPTPPEDAPTVFSTFACGGGSSMGYKRAGYNVIGCCEIDPKVNEVYRRNLHPKLNYLMDLREFNQLEDLPDELYHLDVLDGSPPCTTFSVCGQREKTWGVKKQFHEGQRKQRLDNLFFTYLETVDKLRPKVSIAENVPGLLNGNARGYVSEILSAYKALGYSVQVFKLDAQYANVPQQRNRLFFIANRLGKKIKLRLEEEPIPFGAVRSEHGQPVKSAEMRRVIGMRKPTDTKIAETYERVGEKYRRFNHVYAYDNRPSPAITATGKHIRFADGDLLSVDDVAAVSTFPKDYDFCGAKYTRVVFLAGMSVPPNLMANIATQVKAQCFDG